MTMRTRKKISDKERLDWMAKHLNLAVATTGGFSVSLPPFEIVHGRTLRAAIDAAIRSERKGKHA